MELKFTERNKNSFIKWCTLKFNSQNSVHGQRLSQGSQSLHFLVWYKYVYVCCGDEKMMHKKVNRKISFLATA